MPSNNKKKFSVYGGQVLAYAYLGMTIEASSKDEAIDIYLGELYSGQGLEPIARNKTLTIGDAGSEAIIEWGDSEWECYDGCEDLVEVEEVTNA